MTDELVLVRTVSSSLEGEIVKSRLEDEGIPVLLKGGGDDPYRVGPVHVFVAAAHEVQARLVLDQGDTAADPARSEPGDD
ncbi:MAG TPA: DUF2007 domain-containing protein [Actinomycetota bacterium]|jgi:hypothetical protein